MQRKKSRSYNKDAVVSQESGAVKFGLGAVPYCESSKCWLLPAGPAQQERKIMSRALAMQFAMQLNELICNAAKTASNRNKAE